MATWRYVARLSARVAGESEFIAEKTTLFACEADSEDQAVGGLEDFLDSHRGMSGENLRWVAVERTDTDTAYTDSSAEWAEVKRLEA